MTTSAIVKSVVDSLDRLADLTTFEPTEIAFPDEELATTSEDVSEIADLTTYEPDVEDTDPEDDQPTSSSDLPEIAEPDPNLRPVIKIVYDENIPIDPTHYAAGFTDADSFAGSTQVVLTLKKVKVRFDIELLKQVVERDKCVVANMDLITKCNRDTRITYKCVCGLDGEKTLRGAYENGANCNDCGWKIRQARMRATTNERYGVENASQSKQIKEKKRLTCLSNYGVQNPAQVKQIQEKMKATVIERMGVENPSQAEVVKEKKAETTMKSLGVENPFQSDKVKKQIIVTTMEKYGVPYITQSADMQSKSCATNMEKRGVKYALQSEDVKLKSRATCMEHYGVEHYIQSGLGTHGFARHKFVFPSGNIREVQGYERFALALLVQEGFEEQSILTERVEVPEIWYVDEAGDKHRYFVDIYIPSYNTCIEVKSTWTLSFIQPLKEAACKAGDSILRFGHLTPRVIYFQMQTENRGQQTPKHALNAVQLAQSAILEKHIYRSRYAPDMRVYRGFSEGQRTELSGRARIIVIVCKEQKSSSKSSFSSLHWDFQQMVPESV